jgi:hypothetical protein
MDNDKDDKSLIEKTIAHVKDIASSVTEAIKTAPPSERVETAVPPVEENFDAPPMTAEELAHHAAADTQPVITAQTPLKEAAAPSLSGRVTPTYDIPTPDTPMPSPKKRKTAVKKKVVKKPAKAAKKSSKKAVKKAKAKKAGKKTAPKKSKKVAKKTAKKSPKKKGKKSKR